MNRDWSGLDCSDSALSMTLGDVLHFINWMHQVQKALDSRTTLPKVPKVESAKVGNWIQLIERLHERSVESEERRRTVETQLKSQENALGRLLSHLHGNIASLYDNLGQAEQAQEARKKAEILHQL